MAKTWLMILAAIVAIGIGAAMVYLWGQLRPTDDPMTVWGVGALTTLAAFISIYFMTKSS